MINDSNYAFVAGIFASLASFFGKLMSTDSGIPQKLLCVVLMISSNAMVWTFFVKALHSKGGSLSATVTSAATNYCFSALLGCLFFAEAISGLWLFGTGLVISGLILTTIDSDENNHDPERKVN